MTELDKKELDIVLDKAINLLNDKEEIVKCLEKDDKIDAIAWCGKYHIDLTIQKHWEM